MLFTKEKNFFVYLPANNRHGMSGYISYYKSRLKDRLHGLLFTFLLQLFSFEGFELGVDEFETNILMKSYNNITK